jgi:hypothetical protein
VGIIILCSLRLVLRGVTRVSSLLSVPSSQLMSPKAFHVTSRKTSASLMLLTLAQLMVLVIYPSKIFAWLNGNLGHLSPVNSSPASYNLSAYSIPCSLRWPTRSYESVQWQYELICDAARVLPIWWLVWLVIPHGCSGVRTCSLGEKFLSRRWPGYIDLKTFGRYCTANELLLNDRRTSFTTRLLA